MNARTILLGAVAALGSSSFLPAANIDRATLTEVVNSVSVINASTKRSSPARTQQLFTAPNVLRTGADSRAEMVAPDSTVTRVGQNSLFSFEPNSREVDLQRGSILFQSPSGKGGGTIGTPAASAAVLGTTLIVTTTKNGGFKVLLVEGKGSVRTNTGKFRRLGAGQMVYALPGGELSNTFEFRLSQQVAAARLLGGFKKPLPSTAKIEAAIQKQEKEIAQGKAIASNLLASDSPNFAIQVDVARDAMIKQSANANAVASAAAVDVLNTDAIIDQEALDERRFVPNATVETELPGQLFRATDESESATGLAFNPLFFVGQNVIFDTPTVDLSPYFGSDLVRFLAINDLSFERSVDLGIFPGGDVQLLAGRTILNQPGVTVSASAKNLSFISLGTEFPFTENRLLTMDDFSSQVPMSLTGFGASNRSGSLLFLTGETDFRGVRLQAASDLAVVAQRDVKVQGFPGTTQRRVVFFQGGFTPITVNVAGNRSSFESETQVRVAAGRDIDIRGTDFASPRTILDGGRSVRLTTVKISDGRAPLPGFFSSSTPPDVDTGPRSLTITGRNLADLRATNIVANNVHIEANTVRLEGVQFRDGSRVVLESRIGALASGPNTGRPVQAGFVNFVRDVRYGNQAAQNAVVQNGPGSPSSGGPNGPGILIRPRGSPNVGSQSGSP